MSLCSAEPLVPEHGFLSGLYDTIGIVDAPAVKAAFSSGDVEGLLGEVDTTLPGKCIKLKGSGAVIEVRI